MSMFKALLGSTCNMVDGMLDGYEVVLDSLRRHVGQDTDDLVTNVMTDISLALVERPAFRRIVALSFAGFLAADRFANGEDYNTAMNESRDLCLKALESPLFMLEAYRLYSSKKAAVIAVFEGFEDDVDFGSDGASLDQVGLILKAFRQVFIILRPALEKAA
jgi:FAD/FMN-containing dehydrogenase